MYSNLEFIKLSDYDFTFEDLNIVNTLQDLTKALDYLET